MRAAFARLNASGLSQDIGVTHKYAKQQRGDGSRGARERLWLLRGDERRSRGNVVMVPELETRPDRRLVLQAAR